MLDDLKYINQKDTQDALGAALHQWEQLLVKPERTNQIKVPANIIFASTGGSAAAAHLVGEWLQVSVPIHIWSSYDGPTYISKNTLVIAVSYSGDTEETLSVVDTAEKAKAQIAIISSGGKLAKRARDKSYPFIELPTTEQPRFGTFSNLVAIVALLEQAGVCTDGTKQLKKVADALHTHTQQWAPEIPTSKNKAKQLALELAGTTPIIHAGTHMYPAAHKWKIDLNENAKNVAFATQIPEFSHNEFIGWTSHPVDKPFSIVDIRSSHEHPRTQKRFEVTEQLLSGKRPHPHTVEAVGDTELEQLLYSASLGMFVSIYVGLLNGQNPTSVDLVTKMKQALDD